MTKYRIISAGAIVALACSLLAGCKPAPPPTLDSAIATTQQIREAIDTSGAKGTLVHVWATWCVPCREEFPELLKAYRDTRGEGLNLQLISADDPQDMELIKQFLQEQNSPLGTVVAADVGEGFINMLSPNWSGALPASFFYDSTGRLVAEWEGKRSYEDYMTTIEQLLTP